LWVGGFAIVALHFQNPRHIDPDSLEISPKPFRISVARDKSGRARWRGKVHDAPHALDKVLEFLCHGIVS